MGTPTDRLSLATLAQESRALIAAHWDAIATLAVALLEHEELSYAEVVPALGALARASSWG